MAADEKVQEKKNNLQSREEKEYEKLALKNTILAKVEEKEMLMMTMMMMVMTMIMIVVMMIIMNITPIIALPLIF